MGERCVRFPRGRRRIGLAVSRGREAVRFPAAATMATGDAGPAVRWWHQGKQGARRKNPTTTNFASSFNPSPWTTRTGGGPPALLQAPPLPSPSQAARVRGPRHLRRARSTAAAAARALPEEGRKTTRYRPGCMRSPNAGRSVGLARRPSPGQRASPRRWKTGEGLSPTIEGRGLLAGLLNPAGCADVEAAGLARRRGSGRGSASFRWARVERHRGVALTTAPRVSRVPSMFTLPARSIDFFSMRASPPYWLHARGSGTTRKRQPGRPDASSGFGAPCVIQASKIPGC